MEAINGRESNEILQLKHDFLSWKVPNELTDTLYISRLEEFDFDKEKIETAKFDSLRDIFQYKKHTDFFSARCLPTYNDILIFKNKGEIIGIAKICFGSAKVSR